MRHDQIFKELLGRFFREFMELFFSGIADRLDFSRVTFLDKETFTDLPEGEQRRADVVAQVYTRDGQPEIILTHIEVEARRRGDFPKRMFEYYMMLSLRHRLPIYPVVIYLAPGAGGRILERHVERVFEQETASLTYNAIGLPDLSADDYQEQANPLGPALSALMQPSRLGRVVQKYTILRAMALADVDEAGKALLTNVIETYLPLKADEQDELRGLIAKPEGKEIREMISVYEQRGRERGREEGIEQGIEQGIERGIEQGIEQGIERGARQAKRETLLRMLRHKFGDLPAAVSERIEALADPEEMDRLIDRAIDARSLDELGPADA